MKNTAIKLMSLAVLTFSLAVISAQAQSAIRYAANIPFDFFVGKEWFKRGEYKVQLANPQSANGAIMISSADGKDTRIFMSTEKYVNPKNAMSSLIFNRYDTQYFLSAVVTPTLGADFPKSSNERQMAKRQTSETEVVAVRNQK